MKVLVSCANGAGTSLMMKMKVQQALKDLNVNVEKIHHCSISEARSASITSPEQGAQQEWSRTFLWPSGGTSLGRWKGVVMTVDYLQFGG